MANGCAGAWAATIGKRLSQASGIICRTDIIALKGMVRRWTEAARPKR
jgi:hypothetical protein